jgi:regulatory protein YycH of two-component signal transduction system YycFG
MELQAIISTLQRLEKMHRSLLEIALSKTEYVKNNDLDQLDAILKAEQSHVAAIETFEIQRQQQVQQYMISKGVQSATEPTISNLLEVAQGEQFIDDLKAVRESLLDVLQQLKTQNDLNQKLVFQSLQFVNVSLNMLRPQAPQEQINYSDKEVLRQDRVAKNHILIHKHKTHVMLLSMAMRFHLNLKEERLCVLHLWG